MLNVYICTNVPNNMVIVVGRSTHHAEMQLVSLMIARGWERPEGWEPVWGNIFNASAPGVYLVGK